MALGFPASHTETYSTEIENEKVFDLVKEVISGFGWEVDTHLEEGIINKIIAKVPSNALSWGLKVEVSNIKPGLFEIKSKSILQVIDYGANEKAVKQIISSLENAIKTGKDNKKEIKAHEDVVIKDNKSSEVENSEKVKNPRLEVEKKPKPKIKKESELKKPKKLSKKDNIEVKTEKKERNAKESVQSKAVNVKESLNKLKEMLDDGLIEKADYDVKKKDLLGL